MQYIRSMECFFFPPPFKRNPIAITNFYISKNNNNIWKEK